MKTALLLLLGMTIQPYLSLAYEHWLSRPRRFKPVNYYDHCKGCTIE
jgi:hypothetical protein